MQGHVGGRHRADVELAFRADVDEVHFEADRHAQAHHQQRDHLLDGLLHIVGGAEGTGQHLPVDHQGVVAADGDHQARHAQGDDHGDAPLDQKVAA